jgi:methylase of polypeptide subunit release factors
MNYNIEPFDLDCDITLSNICNMDGGGSTHYKDFLSIVRDLGKGQYTKGLEWCAGPGFIGYSMLGHNICDHMVFMDKFAPAIESVNDTATEHNLSDRVTTYVLERISDIPESEKFDLVLGNPPHVWDRDQFMESIRAEWTEKNHELKQENIDVLERLLLDHGKDIHKEFFDNISSYLLPGADLFISEPGGSDVMPEMKTYGKSSGLVLMSERPMYAMRNTSPGAMLYHYRKESQ